MIDEIRAEDQGWYRLGSMLLKIGLLDKAREVYKALLNQTHDYFEKERIYNRQGTTHDDKGYHQEAISFYEGALAMYEKIQPTPLCHSATNQCHIGDYSKARSFCEHRRTIPPTNSSKIGRITSG